MERGNNTAERLWRLDKLKTPFVKKKERLGMNFQENVEVKAREAQLYTDSSFILILNGCKKRDKHRSVKSVGHATGAQLVGIFEVVAHRRYT